MKREGVELIEENFDNLENHNSYIKKSHGVFIAKDDLTAHGTVGDYIAKMKAKTFYLGYDGIVYPRFVVKPVDINPEEEMIE